MAKSNDTASSKSANSICGMICGIIHLILFRSSVIIQIAEVEYRWNI